MMRISSSAKYGILFAVLLCVDGCSGGKNKDRSDVVPVSGTVIYKAKPVVGATVVFMSPGASRAATGVTDSDGKFQLSTFQANDGAVIGEHQITVTKSSGDAGPPPDVSSDPDAMTKQYQQMMKKSTSKEKPAIPAKYADVKTSKLKETVTEGGPNTFVLQLTD